MAEVPAHLAGKKDIAAPMLERGESMEIQRGNLVLQHNHVPITDRYQIEKKTLGTGSYGSVSVGVSKDTKLARAVKTMPKKNIKNEQRFQEEIMLMKRLDHPNILKLFETFEDKKNIYLVLELCSGGELFDRIVDKGLFDEKSAAIIVQQTLAALFYLHKNQIMHRDLKPENFLFASKEDDAPLKIIDFGLGARFEPGQRMTTKAGTPYYVAPQVLKGDYNELCDVWSTGVITYILLSGMPPFYGDKDQEILARVKRGKFDFPDDEGIVFSDHARDCISAMLTFDEKKRPAAKELLQHPWVKGLGVDHTQHKVSGKAVGNLKAFAVKQRFHKVALTAVASQLDDAQVKNLKETFLALDKDKDGSLTFQEIIDGCKSQQVALPEGFTEDAFRLIDTDKSGSIDYTEFLAATMDRKLQTAEDTCWAAFRVFDRDGDGKITVQELGEVLNSSADEKVWTVNREKIREMISEFDANGDDSIDFDEFMAMMKKHAL